MKKVNLIIPSLLLLVLILAGNIVQAGTLPTVLKEMPTDAMVVVATQPLAGIFAKANKAAVQYEIVPPDAQLDLGEMFSAQLATGFGVPVKLDTSKGIGLAIMNVMMGDDSLVIYLPIKDSRSFIESLSDKKESGEGIWKLQSGPYVTASGNYMVLAGNAEILNQQAQTPKGIKLSDSQTELFANSDVSATIGLTQLLPMAKAMAQGALMSNPDIQAHTSLSTTLIKGLDRVTELESAGMGMFIGESGVNMRLNLQAQKGTALASYLSDHPMVASSELGTLPAGNFFAATAMNFNPKLFTDVLKTITDAVLADEKLSEYVNKSDIDQLNTLFDESFKLQLPAVGGNYIFDKAEKSSAMNVGTINKYKNDCSEIPELSGKLLPLISKIIKKASGELQIEVPMTYIKDAGISGSFKYDKMVIDLSKLPLPPQALQSLSVSFGGEPKMNMYMQMPDARTMVSSMNKEIMAKTIALAKSPVKLSSHSAMAAFRKNLPTKANCYTLVDMGAYMKMIAETMQAQMQAVGADAQPMMGPITMISSLAGQINGTLGGSVVMENGCAKTDMYLSSDLIKSAYKTGQMAFGMMMGAMAAPDSNMQ